MWKPAAVAKSIIGTRRYTRTIEPHRTQTHAVALLAHESSYGWQYYERGTTSCFMMPRMASIMSWVSGDKVRWLR
jgi:hypothetical protein